MLTTGGLRRKEVLLPFVAAGPRRGHPTGRDGERKGEREEEDEEELYLRSKPRKCAKLTRRSPNAVARRGGREREREAGRQGEGEGSGCRMIHVPPFGGAKKCSFRNSACASLRLLGVTISTL